MNTAQAPTLSTKSYRTGKINIDTESKVIKNVIMAKAGEARGHNEWIEQSFIDDLVKYANKHQKKDGVRCYFGHNYSNLGKRVGRFYNVRLEDGCAIADLHLYDSANDSPILPGAADYILSMANEDEKSIMLSIKYRPEQYYQYDSNQKKIRVWYYDEDQGWISPNRKQKIYVEFKELVSCDIVDDGALTDSLYDSGSLQVQFNDIINHPDFTKVLETNYQSFTVLNEFYAKQNDKGLMGYIKNLFKNKSTEMDTDTQKETATETTTSTEETTAYAALEAKFDQKLEELTASYDQKLEAQKTAYETQITALKNEAADEHTTGDTEEEDPAEKPATGYRANPINERAKKMYARRNKGKDKQ